MMKRSYVILTTLLLLFSVACKELGNDKKKSEKVSFGRTIIDSVIEEDTIKISDSVLLRYSSKLLWFPDLEDKNLLREIYQGKEITDFSRNGLQDYLKQEKENLYNRIRNSNGLSEVKQQQQWSYISSMNVRMNRNNYVSVQYYTSQSGAQDKVSYYYEEKVFDFKNLKKLQLSDMITLSEETVKRILKLNLGKTTIMQQIKTYDSETYALISAASFPVTPNFYFDDYNLYFHYNANEIIHDDDIGDLVITVPWNDLSDYLKPDFARRMKIN